MSFGQLVRLADQLKQLNTILTRMEDQLKQDLLKKLVQCFFHQENDVSTFGVSLAKRSTVYWQFVWPTWPWFKIYIQKAFARTRNSQLRRFLLKFLDFANENQLNNCKFLRNFTYKKVYYICNSVAMCVAKFTQKSLLNSILLISAVNLVKLANLLSLHRNSRLCWFLLKWLDL